jgi:PII-like signaling protein
MSQRLVKLTTYFGERDRVARRLLADELLDVYAEQGVRASILLRATEGFGRLHHLHTDRLLSLSEDLPVVSIALHGHSEVEALLQRVLAIKRRGLVTLERARVLSSDDGGELTDGGREQAAKLTVFVGRRERVGDRPAFVAICEMLHDLGLDGASVLLGVDGLHDGRRMRARFFSRNSDVPLMVECVGPRRPVWAALAELRRVLRDPLILHERVLVCKRDGRLLARPRTPTDDERRAGLSQKLTVYSSHDARHGGRPLHLEIVRRLRASEAAGVTSLTGVWGFHGARPPHGDRLLQVHRHVPVATVTIDSPERIARSFQIIDELTDEHGLVTSELVPVMHAPDGVTSTAVPRLDEAPG